MQAQVIPHSIIKPAKVEPAALTPRAQPPNFGDGFDWRLQELIPLTRPEMPNELALSGTLGEGNLLLRLSSEKPLADFRTALAVARAERFGKPMRAVAADFVNTSDQWAAVLRVRERIAEADTLAKKARRDGDQAKRDAAAAVESDKDPTEHENRQRAALSDEQVYLARAATLRNLLLTREHEARQELTRRLLARRNELLTDARAVREKALQVMLDGVNKGWLSYAISDTIIAERLAPRLPAGDLGLGDYAELPS